MSVHSHIPYATQNIDQDDIATVVEALKSDWLTQGPAVEKFESQVAKYCNVKYAVAVSNATAALHLTYLALGLSNKKSMWTSPNTFLATSNAALYCGGQVDFVDINPQSFNMCPEKLEEKLIQAQKQSQLPKIVTAVHLAGQSAQMDKIFSLSKKYGFAVVEDASHAIGGSYLNHKVGSCQYSDACIFSFHPVKIITTGEGGMITTNNKDLYEKLILLRSHGMTRDTAKMKNTSHGPWYYEQIDLGFNYRLTDIQAALGCSQMKKIDQFIAKRHSIAEKYNAAFAKHESISVPWQDNNAYSAFHLYIVKLDHPKKTKKQIFDAMIENNIKVNLHYIPVYLQPYYKNLGFGPGLCPEAEKYYAQAMSLPMYVKLTQEQQDYVIKTLLSVMS